VRSADERKTQRARSLRRSSTAVESEFWQRVRHRQLGGLKFIRQAPVGRYYVDFLCREFGWLLNAMADNMPKMRQVGDVIGFWLTQRSKSDTWCRPPRE